MLMIAGKFNFQNREPRVPEKFSFGNLILKAYSFFAIFRLKKKMLAIDRNRFL